jgi:hypothetical protein
LYLREFLRTKELNIPWYSFIEFPIICLTIYTFVLWFKIFGRRNTFYLPLDNEQEYLNCIPYYFALNNFLKISPILVVF